jgi:hypothetical protein
MECEMRKKSWNGMKVESLWNGMEMEFSRFWTTSGDLFITSI